MRRRYLGEFEEIALVGSSAPCNSITGCGRLNGCKLMNGGEYWDKFKI